MFPLEFLHGHKAPTHTDSQRPVTDSRYDKARADQVFRVVDADDGHTQLVQAHVVL